MEIDCKLTKLFNLNQSTEQPWHTIYIVLYVSFTIASFTCNALLLMSLYLQSKTRRPRGTTNNNTEKTRDILVAHLAAFDLLLSITMPFTALDALSKYWPLGSDTEMICRLVKSIPSVAVYSSSMIIVTIAVNCCHTIICHSGQQLKPRHLKYITPTIVVIAIVMSSPIFYYAKLYFIVDPVPFNESTTSHDIGNTTFEVTTSLHLTKLAMEGEDTYGNESFLVFPTSPMNGINDTINDTIEMGSPECTEDEKFEDEDWFSVVYCIEDWPFEEGPSNDSPMDRVYYSLFSLFFQLIIPGIIISVSYFLIYQRLRRQSITRERMMSENRSSERMEREHQRSKRRNKMLAIMSLIFLISWLPLSIIGVLLDSKPDILGNDIELVTIVFMTCHLIGMSSAFANPIIYGYSNKNIRKELINRFDGVFSKIRKRFARRTEQPRRCSLTEDELEMQNMMAGDIATSSHDALANDVIKRISEELSQNDRFFENNIPENDTYNTHDRKQFVSRSVSAFTLRQDKAFKIINQTFRRSVK